MGHHSGCQAGPSQVTGTADCHVEKLRHADRNTFPACTCSVRNSGEDPSARVGLEMESGLRKARAEKS